MSVTWEQARRELDDLWRWGCFLAYLEKESRMRARVRRNGPESFYRYERYGRRERR